MSLAQKEKGKWIIHTWEQLPPPPPDRCNCISLVLLKLNKSRHHKVPQAAPCLHMETMLEADPKTSK